MAIAADFEVKTVTRTIKIPPGPGRTLLALRLWLWISGQPRSTMKKWARRYIQEEDTKVRRWRGRHDRWNQ